MGKIWLLVFMAFPMIANAQQSAIASLLKQYKSCKTETCQIKTSFLLAQKNLEIDQIDSAQTWLNKTKDLIELQKTDTINCYVHSLQSELFYYTGLHQFGIYEANKEIHKALVLKDSGLASDGYFFLGINQYELNQFEKSSQSLSKSNNYLPKKGKGNRLHGIIREEHIYNNLSQVKLKLNDPDSSFWYNDKAYQIALQNGSKRVIANSEQAFGLIYLSQKKLDSARFYLKKSINSAFESRNFDLALLSTGHFLECFSEDKNQALEVFQDGESLMRKYAVNSAFQRQFYTIAIKVLQETRNTKALIEAHQKVLKIDDETRLKGNFYIQNITEQYVKSENKLLSLRIEELQKQRSFTVLQLIAALLCVLILLLIVIIIRRKNKIQHKLLDQKNEISKDLHDDIGSGLSSILILANLLLKNEKTPDNQKLLISKIDYTGKEISQKLNTFIWSLNVENNNLQDFCEYVKKYAVNQYEATEVNFTFSEHIALKEQIQINGNDRKNLFFCVKEMLNNSMKHSKATEVNLTISITEKRKLNIILQDNGIGICNEIIFGNGLSNIQKRIMRLNGTFKYANDNGFQSKISIPV